MIPCGTRATCPECGSPSQPDVPNFWLDASTGTVTCVLCDTSFSLSDLQRFVEDGHAASHLAMWLRTMLARAVNPNDTRSNAC